MQNIKVSIHFFATGGGEDARARRARGSSLCDGTYVEVARAPRGRPWERRKKWCGVQIYEDASS